MKRLNNRTDKALRVLAFVLIAFPLGLLVSHRSAMSSPYPGGLRDHSHSGPGDGGTIANFRAGTSIGVGGPQLTKDNLTVSSVTVATMTASVATASSMTITTAYIKGTTSSDTANVGNVGEYIEDVGADASGFATSGNFADAAHLLLSAGDWDVSAILIADSNGATWSRVDVGISTNSGNSTQNMTAGNNWMTNIWANSATSPLFFVAELPNYRMSLSGAGAVVYMKARSTYTAGSPLWNSVRLSARRVR